MARKEAHADIADTSAKDFVTGLAPGLLDRDPLRILQLLHCIKAGSADDPDCPRAGHLSTSLATDAVFNPLCRDMAKKWLAMPLPMQQFRPEKYVLAARCG